MVLGSKNYFRVDSRALSTVRVSAPEVADHGIVNLRPRETTGLHGDVDRPTGRGSDGVSKDTPPMTHGPGQTHDPYVDTWRDTTSDGSLLRLSRICSVYPVYHLAYP